MTFGREKRLLLGLLAFLAPLPLPFNELVGWTTYGLYAVALVVFLHRVQRGAERWLPTWGANVAAIAYLPFFLLDLEMAMGGVLVRPVLRLALFAVTVKLFSLRRERDKWHAVLGIFFLFLAAMATSVHLTVIVYLVLFFVLLLLLLARFALLHLLAGFGWRDTEVPVVPLARFLAVVTVATAVLAVPLFAALPRVETPFVGGPIAGGPGNQITVAGFSDQVALGSMGRLRDNREVALRLDFGDGGPPGEVRLKGGTYERYRSGIWGASAYVPERGRERGSEVTLAGGRVAGSVRVYRMPMRSHSLPMPVESLRLHGIPRAWLDVDRGGAVHLERVPDEPIEYRLDLAAVAAPAAVDPEPGSDAVTLDQSGVTPRMVELAATVGGTAPAAEKARRLERYLIDNYEYSLDLFGSSGEQALDRFLFEERRGHCEYFASALVLLLRSQAIHARLVTGFLGAEENALGLHVVRHANAHAWVEAWIPGEGWQMFDPTPPAGRPGAGGGPGLLRSVSNLYDALVFQWDRYVLTYGREDQVDAVRGFLASLADAWRRWTAGGGSAVASAVAEATPEAAAAPSPPSEPPPRWPLLVLALAVALLAPVAWHRLRRPSNATGAYRRLRRRLASAGVGVDDATGPMTLARAAAARWSAAAAPAERIVALYVKESFGGVTLDEQERGALTPALAEIGRAVRERPA